MPSVGAPELEVVVRDQDGNVIAQGQPTVAGAKEPPRAGQPSRPPTIGPVGAADLPL